MTAEVAPRFHRFEGSAADEEGHLVHIFTTVAVPGQPNGEGQLADKYEIIWRRIGEVREQRARGERINMGSYLVKLVKLEAQKLGLAWAEEKDRPMKAIEPP